MNGIVELVSRFFRTFKVWQTVAPWEQALRVRAGKWVKRLKPGMHFKFPVLDVIYVQSVRLRVASYGKQTLTTKDNKTLTLGGAIGYCVEDIGTVYRELHHAEDTIQQLARAAVAQYVATHALADCAPAAIEAHLGGYLDFARFGLGCSSVYITDFAVVRTYRLIGDQQYGMYGDSFNTQEQPS